MPQSFSISLLTSTLSPSAIPLHSPPSKSTLITPAPFIFYVVPLQPHYLPPASTLLPHFLLAQAHNGSSKSEHAHTHTHTMTHEVPRGVRLSLFIYLSRTRGCASFGACQVKTTPLLTVILQTMRDARCQAHWQLCDLLKKKRKHLKE